MIDQYINQIINADCLDILRQLPNKCVDLVFTDVPYRQEFHDRGLCAKRPTYAKIDAYGSNLDVDYRDFFALCLQKLKKVNFFTFCNKETKIDFILLAKEYGFSFEELTFCKTAPTPFTNNQWLTDTEYGIHIFKNLPVMGEYSTKCKFWVMPNFKETGINHPSAKKVSVVTQILSNISAEDNLVLDCFSGSGTTAVACHNLHRRFICIEKDPDYWKASVDRLEKVQQQLTLF